MARLRQRIRRKMLRQKKKDKSKKKLEDSECSPDERLNCFSHNNEHWKTPPFWNDGSFCACTNSNTNTYSCVRNVNGTHNYLYCEFVSGLITYYNLKVDPYQLRNIYLTLSTEELNFMHHQLAVLKNHGLKYSRMYSTFARQRSFIKRYGKQTSIPKKCTTRIRLELDSERMSFEESALFLANLAFITHIRPNDPIFLLLQQKITYRESFKPKSQI